MSFLIVRDDKSWRVNIEHLTDEDIEIIAKMVSEKIAFSKVIGYPRLAKALEKYKKDETRWCTLIVSDVFSPEIREMKKEIDTHHHAEAFVVFSFGPLPAWVQPLFWVGERYR